MRAFVRPAAAVVVAAAVSVLLLTGAIQWLTPVPVAGPVADGGWVARTRAWFTPRGFSPAEVDLQQGRHFSWTGGHADVVVREIDRSRPYRITLRIAAGRGPDVPPPPHIVLSVDGVPRVRTESTNDPRDYSVEAPVSPRETLAIGLDVSNTFVPGPNDSRQLGVMVDAISIEPIDASFRPTSTVLLNTALAAGAYALAVALCGVGWIWVLLAGLVAGALHAWLLALDAAFIGDYAGTLLHIGTGVAAIGTVVGAIRLVWRPTLWPEWHVAAAVVLTLGALKLAFFAHEGATIGDSIFQVHRAQYVAAGNYFFTSITPRPFFEFPYAIALYVNAMPFWSWFPGELDRVVLLRGLAIAADSAVGLAMYFAFRAAWKQPWPAVMFAALWPFAKTPFGALCTSNLTNLYGQGVFGVAMALVGVMAVSARQSLLAWVAIASLLAVGFLSHFSTLSVGVPLAGLVAVILVGLGRTTTRRTGAWLLLSLALASSLSYVVYYSHFHEVYQKTIDRVAAREGEAESRSMVAPVPVKAERWLVEVVGTFGSVVLAAAAVGAVWLFYQQPRDGLTLVFTGWTLAWVIFSLLGIFTAIEMRSNLAAAPLMLGLAAFALGSVARTSRAGSVAAVAVGTLIAWNGFHLWTSCLTG